MKHFFPGMNFFKFLQKFVVIQKNNFSLNWFCCIQCSIQNEKSSKSIVF